VTRHIRDRVGLSCLTCTTHHQSYPSPLPAELLIDSHECPWSRHILGITTQGDIRKTTDLTYGWRYGANTDPESPLLPIEGSVHYGPGMESEL
jgi:hypothetical protein